MRSNVLLLLLVLLISSCTQNTKREEAENIIELVYEHQKQHGEYPRNINEIGLMQSESGPVYYQLEEDGNSFIVSYGKSLGESAVYKSTTKEWYNAD